MMVRGWMINGIVCGRNDGGIQIDIVVNRSFAHCVLAVNRGIDTPQLPLSVAFTTSTFSCSREHAPNALHIRQQFKKIINIHIWHRLWHSSNVTGH